MKMTRFLTNTIGTAMLAGALMLAPQAAQARVFVSVGFAPPAIPVYVQPVCPGDGYIWTPGYWAYTDDGYEWVDGAWVLAPYTGALWTPGYWAYGPGGYFWNAGYWGPTVGYYGGINYGFGYFGVGFYGGYWNGGHFFYNREYNHFGAGGGFRNVYDRRVEGFDGHPGGVSFARAENNENRGGSFNNAGAHPFSGGAGGYNIAQNQSGLQEYGDNRTQEGSSFRGNSNLRLAEPVNSVHPSQGSNIAGNFNLRPTAPVNNIRPAQSSSFTGGAQHSAPAPSFQGGGGGFHGAGGFGGGSHGGGGRR